MTRTKNGLISKLFIEQGGDDTILHFCTYFWSEFWISAGVEEIADFTEYIKSITTKISPKLFLNSSYFIFMCATGDLTNTLPIESRPSSLPVG